MTPVIAEQDVEKTAAPVAKAEEEPQPTPAEPEPVTLASHTESATETKSETGDAPTDAALARGQEPKDDLTTKSATPPNDLDAAMDAITSDRPAIGEPKRLAPPTTPIPLNGASQTAKQAFNNSPQTVGDDRYGAAGASPSRETPAPATSCSDRQPVRRENARRGTRAQERHNSTVANGRG